MPAGLSITRNRGSWNSTANGKSPIRPKLTPPPHGRKHRA
jgi:hypothetical protein